MKHIVSDVCSVNSACSTWCGGKKRTVTHYTWSHSGKDLSHTNWAPNQPSRYDPCINIRHSGRWNDALCDDSFKFECEKPLQISQAVTLDDKKWYVEYWKLLEFYKNELHWRLSQISWIKMYARPIHLLCGLDHHVNKKWSILSLYHN